MKGKKNIIHISVIILVTMLILSKLFLNVRYQGHDTIFHVTNIIKLSDTISFNNIFGSNIITYDFNKFGYGVWLFYPKIPHLIASYIFLMTKNIYLSMNIVYFITTLLSGIFIYYLSKKIFNNKSIALLSSIIYITIPYHVCEIYIRDAFSENFMFMLLPMIFLGLYNLKENNYVNFYILFILGYVIGINSHLASMFFCTIFIGIFILYYRKYFFKKDRIKALLISTLIVIGLTLPFLVTVLEHKSLGIYRVFTEEFSTIYGVQDSSLDFESLYNQKAILNNVRPYFNMVTIILFIFTTINFIFNKKDKFRKDKKIFLILIVIVVNIVCSKEIWNYVPTLFLAIQFPWRLLVFLSLIISLYSPSILISDKIPNYIKKILLILLLFVILFEGINNIDYFTDEEIAIEDALVSSYSMGYQNEYMPNVELTENNIILYFKWGIFFKGYTIVTDNDVSVEVIKDNFPNMEIVVNDLNTSTVIELPRTYYLGYELRDEEGKQIELRNSKYGYLEATIDKDGVYKLSYVKTKLHRLAEFIRLTTILILLGVLVVKFIKWKKRKL